MTTTAGRTSLLQMTTCRIRYFTTITMGHLAKWVIWLVLRSAAMGSLKLGWAQTRPTYPAPAAWILLSLTLIRNWPGFTRARETDHLMMQLFVPNFLMRLFT